MTLLETTSGVLSVISIGERPISINDYLSERTPTLIVFPDYLADIAVELYLPSGERMNSPENIKAVLSYYLLVLRGIPREALRVRVGTSIAELPSIKPYRDVYKYFSQIPYHISHQSFNASGGIECRLATVKAETSSRIIMLENEPDPTFLKRLKVIKGLTDCERAIAARKTEHGFFFTSTDRIPTLDAALALTAYLGSQGELEELTLTTDIAAYRTLSSREGVFAYLPFSHIT